MKVVLLPSMSAPPPAFATSWANRITPESPTEQVFEARIVVGKNFKECLQARAMKARPRRLVLRGGIPQVKDSHLRFLATQENRVNR
jgi:hypothetical protein